MYTHFAIFSQNRIALIISFCGGSNNIFADCIATRVSQIAGVFQKMIFERCTLFHIMPFAKIIGPVEKNMTKS